MSKLSRHFSLRVSEEFPQRLKIAAAVEGVPLGVFLENLLDQRERKLEAARKRQASPLHRVALSDD